MIERTLQEGAAAYGLATILSTTCDDFPTVIAVAVILVARYTAGSDLWRRLTGPAGKPKSRRRKTAERAAEPEGTEAEHGK